MMGSNKIIDSIVHFFKERGPVVLLQSQSSDHPASEFTYVAGLPTASIYAFGDHIVVRKGSEERRLRHNPWNFLKSFCQAEEEWMFGYLGYDLKNYVEDLYSNNNDEVEAPDFYFMIPGVLCRYNHNLGKMEVLRGTLPEDLEDEPPQEEPFMGNMHSSVTRRNYLEMIKEAQQNRIREGDFYEITFSRQLSASFTGDSYRLYQQMRALAPVPFGAFLSFDDLRICCQSPERFLRKSSSRVYSQPIKGTIKRGETSREDRELRNRLASSEKDRAENLMIVDLVRNDLSRIADPRSVAVKDLFEIQTFGTVHQMVSTIEARTRAYHPIDIIKACYPMGSMTGAPKIRSMKAIEELENYRRGIYSGAIGYIRPDGDFDFNVVIRTAIIRDHTLYFPVGGAITSDSDPEREWEETEVKARALTRIFE